MLKQLIRAGRWSELPSERWVRPTLWILAAVVLIGTCGAYLHADSGGFWDWIYGL